MDIEKLKDPEWVMAPEEFQALAVALFGPRWRRALARALEKNWRWVPRYALPEGDPRHRPVPRSVALSLYLIEIHPELAEAVKMKPGRQASGNRYRGSATKSRSGRAKPARAKKKPHKAKRA